jgi:hypothetical protein
MLLYSEEEVKTVIKQQIDKIIYEERKRVLKDQIRNWVPYDEEVFENKMKYVIENFLTADIIRKGQRGLAELLAPAIKETRMYICYSEDEEDLFAECEREVEEERLAQLKNYAI